MLIAVIQGSNHIFMECLECLQHFLLRTGLGERGIGGSKCGSTGVVAIGFKDGGKMKLLAANVGDARAVLSRKGQAMQLTIDHVPDRCLAPLLSLLLGV